MSRSRSPSTSAISALMAPDSSCSSVALEAPPAGCSPASASRPGRSRSRATAKSRSPSPSRSPDAHVGHAGDLVDSTTCGVNAAVRRSRAARPRRCARCWGRARRGWRRRGRGRRRASRSTACTCAGPGTSASVRSVNRPARRLPHPGDAIGRWRRRRRCRRARRASRSAICDVGDHRPVGPASTGVADRLRPQEIDTRPAGRPPAPLRSSR